MLGQWRHHLQPPLIVVDADRSVADIAKEHFVEFPTGAFDNDVLDLIGPGTHWGGSARTGDGENLSHGFLVTKYSIERVVVQCRLDPQNRKRLWGGCGEGDR